MCICPCVQASARARKQLGCVNSFESDAKHRRPCALHAFIYMCPDECGEQPKRRKHSSSRPTSPPPASHTKQPSVISQPLHGTQINPTVNHGVPLPPPGLPFLSDDGDGVWQTLLFPSHTRTPTASHPKSPYLGPWGLVLCPPLTAGAGTRTALSRPTTPTQPRARPQPPGGSAPPPWSKCAVHFGGAIE